MYKAVFDASALNLIIDEHPLANSLLKIATESAITQLTLTKVLFDLNIPFPIEEDIVKRLSALTKSVVPCSHHFITNAILSNENSSIQDMETLAAIALARDLKLPLWTGNLELTRQDIKMVKISYAG